MLRSLLSPVIAILTLLLLPSVEQGILYLPLIFSLSVGLVNLPQFKVNPVLGVVLFVFQTYAVFIGLAVVTYFSDDFLQDYTLANEDEFALQGIILVTLGGFLAACLLYYFSKYLFKYAFLKRGYYVIAGYYAFVVIIMQVFTKHEYLQFGVEKFSSFLVSWVIFMSLAFSVNLNVDKWLCAFTKKRKL